MSSPDEDFPPDGNQPNVIAPEELEAWREHPTTARFARQYAASIEPAIRALIHAATNGDTAEIVRKATLVHAAMNVCREMGVKSIEVVL